MTTLLSVLAAAAAILALAFGGFLLVGPERIWTQLAGPPDLGPVSFDRLERRETCNDALACSPGACPGLRIDIELPVYRDAPEKLLDRLDRVVSGPDAVRVDDGVRPGYRRYVVRTRLMRFPDTVDAEAVASGDGTLLRLYSRSQLGRGDLGANRARLEVWRARLAVNE